MRRRVKDDSESISRAAACRLRGAAPRKTLPGELILRGWRTLVTAIVLMIVLNRVAFAQDNGAFTESTRGRQFANEPIQNPFQERQHRPRRFDADARIVERSTDDALAPHTPPPELPIAEAAPVHATPRDSAAPFVMPTGATAAGSDAPALPTANVADLAEEITREPEGEVSPGSTASSGMGSPLGLLGGLGGPSEWLSPEGISSAIQMLLLLAVVSLAPAILLMTTCFVRIVVVLGLLRQALGTQQLPPNQVMTSIALFMTLLVMSPVWTRVYSEAIAPYTSHELTLEEAWDAGVEPVRQFMSAQIDRTGNRDDIWLFYEHLPESTPEPSNYDDVPLTVLLPAFMLSELKTAFLIGFQIYLPFLVLDLVVASVTISMGMMMLPPVLISLPFKLLLFVLVDGWHLVVGMLLESFQTFS